MKKGPLKKGPKSEKGAVGKRGRAFHIDISPSEKGAAPFILIFHAVVLTRFALVWTTISDHSVSRVSGRLPQALPGSGFPTANPARPTSAPVTSSPAPLSLDLLLPVSATPSPPIPIARNPFATTAQLVSSRPLFLLESTRAIFFGPQVKCSRFSLTMSRSTTVRLLTHFGARLCSASPDSPPSAYRPSHLCPVLRVIPNSSHNSVIVYRSLRAKLINLCFSSIGNTFFQGICPHF